MTDDTHTPLPLAAAPNWWLSWQGGARQRRADLVAAVCLVIALVILADGLLSQMRGGGSYRIEMIAGTAEPVSGAMGDGRATPEDMEYFPIPAEAPLTFEFQGFFKSYWFGTGMWRGRIHAPEDAESGTYGMVVGLRNTPSSAHQTYTVAVFRSLEEKAAASLSFFRRFTGWNPFVTAAILGIFGLGTALSAYLLGRRCDATLRDMGLVEVFKTRAEKNFERLFAVTGKRDVEGKAFVVYDPGLARLGKAIYDTTEHGITECLFVRGDGPLPAKGALIAFWEHVVPERRPVRRGLVSGLMASRGKTAASAGAPDEPSAPAGEATPDSRA